MLGLDPTETRPLLEEGLVLVAGPEGFRKAAYRKFAIRGPVTPGDDFDLLIALHARRSAAVISAISARASCGLGAPNGIAAA